ncbi:hypothetical protein NGH54_12765 [Staphylococcus xylosus]|nr:hypothetical protein [Staphylococcus xylosus]MEB8071589.1 hypothetical protein [Staphylococcus xylosus]
MFWIIAITLSIMLIVSIISNCIQSDVISKLRYEKAHLKNYIQAYIDKK